MSEIAYRNPPVTSGTILCSVSLRAALTGRTCLLCTNLNQQIMLRKLEENLAEAQHLWADELLPMTEGGRNLPAEVCFIR